MDWSEFPLSVLFLPACAIIATCVLIAFEKVGPPFRISRAESEWAAAIFCAALLAAAVVIWLDCRFVIPVPRAEAACRSMGF